jgi:4-amino-4-deoxy-L-arabinose transferase-like glycosyltransferase
MLILLLPISFISLFLALMGYHLRQRTPLSDWRTAFLQTATFLAAYMVLFSEFLSLFHALTQFWVACFWFLAFIVVALLGWRKGWYSESISFLRNIRLKPDWFDIFAGSILVIILGLLFFIAVKAPVNNNDSLQYHMARVVHWAQNKSLEHYAASFLPQVIHPIWAELAILNFRLTTGNDQFASLVQWFSLCGALIGISAIGKLLGASKSWQWVSIAFAVSLPTGILEATSTQNDYVVGFWLICLLYFSFQITQKGLSNSNLVLIGMTFGLGMLTKGTFFPYSASIVIFLIIFLAARKQLSQLFIAMIVIFSIALLMNLGNWSRNYVSFGTPLGPSSFISKFTGQSWKPIQILSGFSRNLAQNFSTPNEKENELIVTGLKNIYSSTDPAMESFSLEWGWNHEDLAGNPIQVLFIIASALILLAFRKRIKNPYIWVYLLVVLSMYFIFAAVVRYDVYGNRYQLPFFLAWSPLFGIAIGIIHLKTLNRLITILLFISAFPWVLFNRTRPLIAMRDSTDPYTIPCLAGCTAGSILNEPPEKTMFAVWGDLGKAYVEATNQVKQTGCKDIGLKLDSNDLEYAYWYLLGAPQNGMRLENIVTYPELERYLDPNFIPCAIICTTCGDQGSLFGLNRIGSFGNGRIKIFSGGTYTPLQP